mgnify:CR=1 FL=1
MTNTHEDMVASYTLHHTTVKKTIKGIKEKQTLQYISRYPCLSKKHSLPSKIRFEFLLSKNIKQKSNPWKNKNLEEFYCRTFASLEKHIFWPREVVCRPCSNRGNCFTHGRVFFDINGPGNSFKIVPNGRFVAAVHDLHLHLNRSREWIRPSVLGAGR